MSPKVDPSVLNQMRRDWDARAKENAEYYVQTGQEQWDSREFFRSGEISVANDLMPDMHRICGGSRSPRDLDMIEIGCGVGRMTRMLSRIFGHITAVDVSAEMIERARTNLSDLENVTLVLGDGATLAAVGDASQDFAFSFIVFQHIPSLEVIRSYCREVRRVLRPGSLFKFQTNGLPSPADRPKPDTWVGVTLSPKEAADLARSTGFLLERTEGEGTQYFWLVFRKPWG